MGKTTFLPSLFRGFWGASDDPVLGAVSLAQFSRIWLANSERQSLQRTPGQRHLRSRHLSPIRDFKYGKQWNKVQRARTRGRWATSLSLWSLRLQARKQQKNLYPSSPPRHHLSSHSKLKQNLRKKVRHKNRRQETFHKCQIKYRRTVVCVCETLTPFPRHVSTGYLMIKFYPNRSAHSSPISARDRPPTPNSYRISQPVCGNFLSSNSPPHQLAQSLAISWSPSYLAVRVSSPQSHFMPAQTQSRSDSVQLLPLNCPICSDPGTIDFCTALRSEYRTLMSHLPQEGNTSVSGVVLSLSGVKK